MFTTPKSDYEMLRERNIRERDKFLASSDDEGEADEFKRSMKELKEFVQSTKPIRRVKRKNQSRDTTFRCAGSIPNQRRKSQRIAKLPPSHTIYDLEEKENNRFLDMDDVENLEKVIFKPKKISRNRNPRKIVKSEIVPVEEVTENMIANIAQSYTIWECRSKERDGTTCHQCRQKTLCQKTVCRSGECAGINGQVCGPCLKNRYGEDVAAALKNPSWACPYCRGVCNCSLCRGKKGKRPTGILAPMALQQGFQSVKHFLDSLNGYGDFAKNDDAPKRVRRVSEDELFLGFNECSKPDIDEVIQEEKNFQLPECKICIIYNSKKLSTEK